MNFAKNWKIIGAVDNVKVAAKPNATPSMSTVVTYNVDKNGDKDWLHKASIVIDVNALSGSGGTYIRFVNTLALFLFKRFEVV